MSKPNNRMDPAAAAAIAVYVSMYVGFLCATIWMLRDARAADLPTASTPADWSLYGFILVVVALAGLVIWLHHRFPSQAAKADIAVKTDAAAATHRVADALEALFHKHAAAPAAPAADATPAPEPAAPAPPGKLGQPGRIVLDVSGDPKVDTAAWQAAYFG